MTKTTGLPDGETADDLRWYATHEAMARHKIFDVLMWLADQIEDEQTGGTP